MGYHLTIGEFEADVDPGDRYARPSAAGAEHEGAPLNSGDNRSNCCSPSYCAWSNFATEAGLYEVFFGGRHGTPMFVGSDGVEREGLIYMHPGAAALTQAHLDAFRAAMDRYQALPEPRPGQSMDGVDYNLRRLEWLIYWTDWALRECEYPTFENL